MQVIPKDIQIIGQELAILWSDGKENYFVAEFLRQHSPSAENLGEKDLFGRQQNEVKKNKFPGIKILAWDRIGNYGIRIDFSDGHNTGIYSWKYLRELAADSTSC